VNREGIVFYATQMLSEPCGFPASFWV